MSQPINSPLSNSNPSLNRSSVIARLATPQLHQSEQSTCSIRPLTSSSQPAADDSTHASINAIRVRLAHNTTPPLPLPQRLLASNTRRPLHLLARLTTVAPDGLLTAVNQKDAAFKSLSSVGGWVFFSNLFIHFTSFQTVCFASAHAANL